MRTKSYSVVQVIATKYLLGDDLGGMLDDILQFTTQEEGHYDLFDEDGMVVQEFVGYEMTAIGDWAALAMSSIAYECEMLSLYEVYEPYAKELAAATEKLFERNKHLKRLDADPSREAVTFVMLFVTTFTYDQDGGDSDIRLIGIAEMDNIFAALGSLTHL